jgi:hypothetical protein
LRVNVAAFLVARLRRLNSVHSDERGTISIISVFTLLMFTMLLIMIVNVGTHIDDKLKMQNAADAATYSGGVVLARGMNGLAFSNHLLSDVFAMTAFLREGRDRNAESLVPPILEAWRVAGDTLSRAPFPKFVQLGQAIINKVPKEQEAVTAYGELTAGAAELSLPVFEHILEAQLIGEFQRDLLETLPQVAQSVTDEVARRHGLLGRSSQEGSSASMSRYEAERGRQIGVLWRTNVMPVALADETDPLTRTMPVVDPDPFQLDYPQLLDADSYLQQALEQRRDLATLFLNRWNFDRLRLFNYDVKMSAFFPLWRMATCGQLERLLNVEYPVTNVPMMLRRTQGGPGMEELIREAELYDPNQPLNRRRDDHFPRVMRNLRELTDLNQYVEDNFHFVGAVYRKHRKELGPGLFENPLSRTADAQTFSQIYLFVPRPRKILVHIGEGGGGGGDDADRAINLGGTFGFTSMIELERDGPPANDPPPAVDTLDRVLRERWVLENYPTHWNLLNQNWMVQLVPATVTSLPEVLQTNPGGEVAGLRMPDYGETENNMLKRVVAH